MKEWHIKRWIGAAAALILSGIYLTWLIDRVTLSTWLQRAFIFGYFVAGAAGLLFLRKCFWNRKESGQKRMILVCSVVGAVLCVFLCKDVILPQTNSAQLGLTNISYTNQNQGNEVWLISLKLDGAEVPLSSLTALENDGWIYSDANDDFYCTETEGNNLLLQLPAHRDAELSFITSSWSGSAEIRYGGGSPQEISLYNPAGESAALYTVNLHIDQAMPVWWSAVLCLGALVVISFLFSWVGELYCIYKQKSDIEILEYCSPNRAKLAAIFIAAFLIVGSILLQQSGQYASFWITQRDSEVTFINEGKDPNGNASEVWLKLFEGGRQIQPEDILVPAEESGWEIRDGNYLSVTPEAELTLPCKVPSDVKFLFQSHAWTGKVSIQWEGHTDSYNFYSTVGTEETVNAPWLGAEEITYNWVHIGLYVLLGFLAWGLLFWLLVKNHQSAWILLFAVSWGAVVLITLDAGKMNGTFMLILALSAGTAVWLQKRPKMMKKYMQGPALIAVLALSVYFTFALAGNGLFLMEKRMDLSSNTISYFVLLTATLCPVIYMIIGILEFLFEQSEKLEPIEDKRKIRLASILFFCLFAGGELCCSLGFYPANMSPDGADHWLQAIGYWKISNGHPPIFPLLIRVLTKIALTPYVYVVFQIVLCAFVLSKWFTFLYKKGVPLIGLVLVDILLSVMPNNFMMLTLISKNPLFSILNLWLLIQIVQLLDNPQKCVQGIRWNVETAISLSGLYLVRYNSFLAVYVATIIIIGINVFNFKRVGWRTAPSLAAAIIMIALVQGPVYDRYIEVNTSGSAMLPPLGPLFSSVVVNEVEVSEDIQNTIEQVLPLEEYYIRYNPYNSDIIGWGDPRPNYTGITTGKGLSIYVQLLFQYPDIVIKERLQGTDLLWSIFQSSDSRGWNHRNLAGIYYSVPKELLPQHLQNVDVNNNGLYFAPNKISKILCNISNLTEHYQIIDMFIWRNGIYIIFALSFVIVLALHHRIRCLLIFIPSVASLITLLLVIGWQIYNYIYFFPIATLAFVSCGCVMTHRSANKTEEGN